MDRKKRILIVDDEAQNRDLLEALLESFGYEYEQAEDGIEALAKIKLDIDLVLLDVMMPGMDGFEVARRIRQDPVNGDVPIIMATSLTDKKDRLRAVEAGANDFIAKPIDKTELQVRSASLLKIKEAQDTIKNQKTKLEEMVESKTADLRKTLKDMVEAQRKTRTAHLDTIRRLSIAAEYKDEDTAAHINRMSNYSSLIAQTMNLSPGKIEQILNASPMHDVGKIGIADNILLKPGKLSENEWKKMKEHTTIGGRILNGSSSKVVQMGEVIAVSHHEKWDGSGYPQGLKHDEIPLVGRITAIADVFDALTTKRPYKEPFSLEKAFDIIKEGRGVHFDPDVTDAFFSVQEEILSIREKYKTESASFLFR
jgi:putative two-component system response regulator